MKNEQWLDYKLLCGLNNFKKEGKTLKKIKDVTASRTDLNVKMLTSDY